MKAPFSDEARRHFRIMKEVKRNMASLSSDFRSSGESHQDWLDRLSEVRRQEIESANKAQSEKLKIELSALNIKIKDTTRIVMMKPNFGTPEPVTLDIKLQWGKIVDIIGEGEHGFITLVGNTAQYTTAQPDQDDDFILKVRMHSGGFYRLYCVYSGGKIRFESEKRPSKPVKTKKDKKGGLVTLEEVEVVSKNKAFTTSITGLNLIYVSTPPKKGIAYGVGNKVTYKTSSSDKRDSFVVCGVCTVNGERYYVDVTYYRGKLTYSNVWRPREESSSIKKALKDRVHTPKIAHKAEPLCMFKEMRLMRRAEKDNNQKQFLIHLRNLERIHNL